MSNRIHVAMVLLLSAGCSASDGTPHSDVVALFGGPPAVEIVQNATTVRAYRLDSYPQKSFSDYEMTAGPVDVPEVDATVLRDVLLDRASYVWEMAKGCEPLYGVRFLFERGDDTVDVLLCFKCDILTVYHNGKAAKTEDFDNIRGELVRVAKRLFPDDDAIQSLE